MSDAVGSHEAASSNNNEPAADEDKDVSVIDMAIVLAKHKWLIVFTTVGATILAVIYALLQPNIYSANAKILPPQQNQSANAALLGQLGALTGGGGGANRGSNDLYVGMLMSRSIADNVLKRFDLQKIYNVSTPGRARSILAANTSVSAGKDNMITIAVEDTDPKRAAELANAYIDELYKLNQSLAVTEASQRRLFFERQLAQARENLALAERSAKQALENGGLVQVEGQGRAMLEGAARLRGQITVKEVQLSVMRSFATNDNPEFLRTQKELEAMRHELAKLEGSGGARNDSPRGRNDAGIDSFRLLRNVKYYETIYDLLGKQYELARVDEAKDSSLIQVLDKAIEPETKSKPNRMLIVLLAAFAAFTAAVGLAFVREALNKVRGEPIQTGRIHILKSYLRWR
jgi:tyrosine-protein kinase Etk/Wzc